MDPLIETYIAIFHENPSPETSRTKLAELAVEGGAGSALLPPELILKCRAEIIGDPSLPTFTRDWAKHEMFPASQ